MEENGFILLKNFLSEEEANKISQWANKFENEEKSEWWIYNEISQGKKLKSRVEHFVPFCSEIKDFITNKLQPLLKKEVFLFKDKMNWKQAGGNGFKAHQDHPAWDDFIKDGKFYSIALFPDGSTEENGCLEFVYGMNKKLLENDLEEEGGLGSIKNEEKYKWIPIETSNKDVLIFDSYAPHRSHENKTNSSRRIFYFTFNEKKYGDKYNEYYEKKMKKFPPDKYREGKKFNNLNNKFNLANPII